MEPGQQETMRTNASSARMGSSRQVPVARPAGSHRPPDPLKEHKIASTTSKVLIHKLDDSVPSAIVNEPHSGWPIEAVSWSHNNLIVATCGENDNQIALAKVENGTIIQEMDVCPKGVSITDVCFSSKSTFIAFGCDDASVGIVNIR